MLTQEVFSGMEPPVTTYSWRRVAPSVGTLLQLDELSMLALGDWQDKGKIRETGAAMPLHYSGTRYAASVRVKHLVLSATARCLSFDTWSEVPPGRLNSADPGLREEVGEKVRLDATVIWRAPAGTPGPQSKLAFKETALRARRRVERLPRERPAGRRQSRLCQPRSMGECALLSCAMVCAFARPFSLKPVGLPIANWPTSVLLFCGQGVSVAEGTQRASDRRLVKPGDVPPAITVAQEAAAGATRPPLPRVRPPPLPVVPAEEEETVEVEVEVEEEPRPHLVASWVDRPRSSGSRAGAAADAGRGRGQKRPREDAESRYDRLAREGRRVDRRALEFPTEIWCSLAGGKLFLGGLPTRANQANFPDIALQVTAMAKPPTDRGGIVLPGALHRPWQITSGDRRDSDFQTL
ncbi:clpC, partial [Symbiodinium sp. CCMP2456]